VQTTIRFGVFEVDLRAGELRKQGVKVKLQEQPLQVLQILLENPGAVVTREQLQQRIWPSDTFVDFDHGLYNGIKRLREALGDSADTPHYIETLARRGYRFIGPPGVATSGRVVSTRSEHSRRLWNNRPAAAAPEGFAASAFILPRGLGTDFS